MKKVLIVIDMQNDFVYDALGSDAAQAIVPNVKKKIEEYLADKDSLVIFTRDTHRANYMDTQEGKHLPVPHCIHGTKGWCVIDELNHPECKHIDKHSFGYPFWSYDLDGDYESIELCGVCTDICVVSNALILKAQNPEVPMFVDASCCAGVTPESHKAALTTMKMCQINVIGE